jgi:hypothetical protein
VDEISIGGPPYVVHQPEPYVIVLQEARRVRSPLRMTRIQSVAEFCDKFDGQYEQAELEHVNWFMCCSPRPLDVVHPL